MGGGGRYERKEKDKKTKKKQKMLDDSHMYFAYTLRIMIRIYNSRSFVDTTIRVYE